MKIGIFDSGLGGKLILDAARGQLPQYDYAYYGDTAHVPYGDRSEEEIYELTQAGVTYLFEQEGCALVVVACNTSSAESVRRLQNEYIPQSFPDRKVLGVIVPTLETVVRSTCQKVLLIGTRRTIESDKYQIELDKLHSDITLTQAATPTLVPYIEAGEYDQTLAEILSTLKTDQATDFVYDGIILGCTHYSVLADSLQQILGERVQVFAQTNIIPHKLKTYLVAHDELEVRMTQGGTVTEYLTGS